MPSLCWGFCSSPCCLVSHGKLHWAASQPDGVKSFERERGWKQKGFFRPRLQHSYNVKFFEAKSQDQPRLKRMEKSTPSPVVGVAMSHWHRETWFIGGHYPNDLPQEIILELSLTQEEKNDLGKIISSGGNKIFIGSNTGKVCQLSAGMSLFIYSEFKIQLCMFEERNALAGQELKGY